MVSLRIQPVKVIVLKSLEKHILKTQISIFYNATKLKLKFKSKLSKSGDISKGDGVSQHRKPEGRNGLFPERRYAFKTWTERRNDYLIATIRCPVLFPLKEILFLI